MLRWAIFVNLYVIYIYSSLGVVYTYILHILLCWVTQQGSNLCYRHFCTLRNAANSWLLLPRSGSSFVMRVLELGGLNRHVLFLLQYEECLYFWRRSTRSFNLPSSTSTLHETYWSMKSHTSSTPNSGASLTHMTQCACGEPLAWNSIMMAYYSRLFHLGVWQLISESLGKTHLACNENDSLQ